MRFSIQPRLLIKLVATFFLATVIGTLSHEVGHWLAAQGFIKPGSARISYMSISWDEKDNLSDSVFAVSKMEELTNLEQQEYEALFKKYTNRKIQGLAGGPLFTIIVGSVGFLLLFFSKPAPGSNSLFTRQWLYVFLALFWLRPVYILFAWIIMLIAGGESSCDEIRIASYLQVSQWITIVPAGLAGIAVAAYVFLCYIPKPEKFSFLLAAVIGCPLSYLAWFYLIGPAVLPRT